MRSLTQRLLVAATAVLVLFLGGIGLILDAAVQDSLAEAVRQRLQAHAYTLLAVAEIEPGGELTMPSDLLEARFLRPDSGLYAQIAGENFFWQSPSAIGENPRLPLDPLALGQTEFIENADIGPEEAFVLRQGVAWETPQGNEYSFVIAVAENESAFRMQVAEFRKTLWFWIGGAAVILLAIQLGVLRWGIRPVKDLATELDQIKRGNRDEIGGAYPRELEGLRDSLNAFIRSERDHLSRYRNSLSDLAHSLKTPLAVLRTHLEGDTAPEGALNQLDRMDELVAYQLKRAKASGHLTMSRPMAVQPQAEQVAGALEKVYRDKQIACEFDIESDAVFCGETGDLMELLGNLLENAFKWGRRTVRLTAERQSPSHVPRPGLKLIVEDDGPGIPPDRAQEVLQRGMRADERMPGHGIGLAIVADIVEAYGGAIRIDGSALGGTRILLEFPEQ